MLYRNLNLGNKSVVEKHVAMCLLAKLSYANNTTNTENSSLVESQNENLSTDLETVEIIDTPTNHSDHVEVPVAIKDSFLELLKRRVILDQFSWGSGDPVVPTALSASAYSTGTIQALRSYDMPSNLLLNSFLHDKLRNFQYFKGNVKLTLKVNANQMQQGMLGLITQPVYKSRSTYCKYSTEYLASLTSNTFVQLNIENTDHVSIIVPFEWKRGIMNLGTDWAFARVVVLVPLRGASDVETISCYTMANILDPEVSVSTDEDDVYRTQSGSEVIQKPEGTAMNVESESSHKMQPHSSGTTSNTMTSAVQSSMMEIITRRALVDRFSWSLSDAPGMLLQSFVCNPVRNNTHPGQVTAFQYLASMFKWWRGSLICGLEFVKTKFHKGRVAVIYFPRRIVAPAFNPDFITTNYNLIIDISAMQENPSVEHQFSVPYLGHHGVNQLLDGHGCVGIYVLTSLVAPDVVADSIDCIVSWHGGEDMQLYVPTRKYAPGVPAAGKFRCQSGRAPIPLVPDGGPTNDISMSLFGKTIQNVEELPQILTPLANTSNGIAVEYNPLVIYRDPLTGKRTTPGNTVMLPESFHSLISSLFAFYHGNAKVRAFMNGINSMTTRQAEGRSYSYASSDASDDEAFIYPQSSLVNPVVDAELPWFRNERQSYTSTDLGTLPVNVIRFSPMEAGKVQYYEGTASDITYRAPVGPPYLVLNTSTTFEIPEIPVPVEPLVTVETTVDIGDTLTSNGGTNFINYYTQPAIATLAPVKLEYDDAVLLERTDVSLLTNINDFSDGEFPLSSTAGLETGATFTSIKRESGDAVFVEVTDALVSGVAFTAPQSGKYMVESADLGNDVGSVVVDGDTMLAFDLLSTTHTLLDFLEGQVVTPIFTDCDNVKFRYFY